MTFFSLYLMGIYSSQFTLSWMFLDLSGWFYLGILGWSHYRLSLWLFPYFVINEFFFLLYLSSFFPEFQEILLLSITGGGWGFLLLLSLWNDEDRFLFVTSFSLVSSLGNWGLILLGNYSLLHIIHHFSFLWMFGGILFVSFLSFVLSFSPLVYYSNVNSDSIWIVQWFTLDFFIFSWGSSGSWDLIYSFSLLMVFWSLFPGSSVLHFLGFPGSPLWWSNVSFMIQIVSVWELGGWVLLLLSVFLVFRLSLSSSFSCSLFLVSY